MGALAAFGALLTGSVAGWSCSLFTSLDGFSNGSLPGDAASVEAALDSGADGPAATPKRWLVIVGGSGVETVASTWLAPIQEDGQLGAWKAGPPLPSARTEVGVAAIAPNAIAAVGGRLAATNGGTAEALVAKLERDELGAWAVQAPMPREIAQHNLVAVPGGVLSIAGFSSGIISDVYFGPVVDGSITTWTARPDTGLPRRALAGAALSGNILYVTGGIDDKPMVDSRSARFTGPGTYQAFTDVTNLPEGRAGLSLLASDRTLIVLGGVALEPSVLTGILPIGDDGNDVTSWAAAPSFETPRQTHAAANAPPFVYVLGGSDKNGVTLDDVQVARVSTSGTLGAWTKTTRLPSALKSMGAAVLTAPR